jgi:hypothetical protein
MDVKGTAFLARKAMLVEEVGEARAAAFLSRHAREDAFFAGPIVATTLIPIERFIAFQEAMRREFYADDPDAYFHFGIRSADWSLTAGPYKHLRASRSIAKFAESGRLLYQNFYTAGRAETSIDGDVIDLRLLDMPPESRHAYVEQAIVGYFQRGLELVGARGVKHRRLRGFTTGDPDVHYQYTFT